MERRNPVIGVVLSALSLLAALLSLYTTSTGTGLAPDSYTYVATARSLLGGHGVTVPNGPEAWEHSAHFPPLYTGLLALSSLGVFDPLQTARWLNAVLFGATVFLAGASVFHLSKGSTLATVVGAAAVLFSDELILIHAQVWSEPPFFFFALAGLLLFTKYLVDGRFRRLAGAAAAFALAFLARYAGATLVVAGGLCLVWIDRRFAGLDGNEAESSSRGRWRGGRLEGWIPADSHKRLALFLAMSCAPVGAWMVYNLTAVGSLTDRALAFHPIHLRDLAQGANTVAGWFLPLEGTTDLQRLLSPLVILAGLALLAQQLLRLQISFRPKLMFRPLLPLWPRPVSHNHGSLRTDRAAMLPYAVFTLIYAAFLLVSRSFFDAQTSLDARILSPILLISLIMVVAGLARWLPRLSPGPRWSILLAAAILAGAHVISGIGMARSLYGGQNKGYAGSEWTGMKLLQQIRGFPADTPIYSNGQDVIYLLTGRPAGGIPKVRSPNSLRINGRFEEEMQAMQAALAEGKGILVVFDELQDRRRYLPSEYDLNELLPLERITRWQKEGTVYRVRQSGY